MMTELRVGHKVLWEKCTKKVFHVSEFLGKTLEFGEQLNYKILNIIYTLYDSPTYKGWHSFVYK